MMMIYVTRCEHHCTYQTGSSLAAGTAAPGPAGLLYSLSPPHTAELYKPIGLSKVPSVNGITWLEIWNANSNEADHAAHSTKIVIPRAAKRGSVHYTRGGQPCCTSTSGPRHAPPTARPATGPGVQGSRTWAELHHGSSLIIRQTDLLI